MDPSMAISFHVRNGVELLELWNEVPNNSIIVTIIEVTIPRIILYGIKWIKLPTIIDIVFFTGRWWWWICHNTVMILINDFYCFK